MNENEIQALNARVQKLEENVASLTRYVNEHIGLTAKAHENHLDLIREIIEILKLKK